MDVPAHDGNAAEELLFNTWCVESTTIVWLSGMGDLLSGRCGKR